MRLAGGAAALNGSTTEVRAHLQRLLALELPDAHFALHSLESLELQIGAAQLQLAVGDAAKGRELLASLETLDREHPGVMARRGRAMLLAALAESSGRCEYATDALRTLEGLHSSPGTKARVMAWRAAHCR